MANAAYEALAKRRITERFISERSVTTSFAREAQVSDGAGGYTTTTTATAAQTFRPITADQYGNPEHRVTEVGDLTVPEWYLVLMPDADVERGDTCSFIGPAGKTIDIVVLYVSTIPDDRKVAECVEGE